MKTMTQSGQVGYVSTKLLASGRKVTSLSTQLRLEDLRIAREKLEAQNDILAATLQSKKG